MESAMDYLLDPSKVHLLEAESVSSMVAKVGLLEAATVHSLDY